jgi:hypothetical protein
MDALEFKEWMRTAEPGAKHRYYRGHLAKDRTSEGPLTPRPRDKLSMLADAVYEEALWDRVLCYQERHGDNDTSYWFIKTSCNARLYKRESKDGTNKGLSTTN